MCGDDFEFISSMPFFKLIISNFNPCISSFIATNLVLRPYNLFFFYQGVLHRHWRFTGQQGKGGDHLLFLSTTSTRSWTLRHLFAIWRKDDYHVFLIATLVFSRLLLDEIYHLIELLFDWLIDDAMFVCLLEELILRFVTTIWHGKLVHLNSHWLSPLYYKQTY